MATTERVPTPTIEVRSIDWVPEDERHGKVWQQGPFWFLGNFQFFTLALGFTGPLVGLSLFWSFVAGGLGILFGTIFMALHATQGPRLGLPQMIQSRAQFGYRGVIVVLFGSLFTFMAFNVVDQLLIAAGLKGIFGWNATAVAILVSAAGALLAIFGHDWLHKVFRIILYVSVPVFVLLTIGVLTGNAGEPAAAPGLGFTFVGFMVMFTVAMGYNITYAPYVSDYTRYLPKETRRAVRSSPRCSSAPPVRRCGSSPALPMSACESPITSPALAQPTTDFDDARRSQRYSVETDAVVIGRSFRTPEVFGEVFDRHWDSVCRYCRSRAGDAGEDLAAETFRLAFDWRGTYELIVRTRGHGCWVWRPALSATTCAGAIEVG